MPHRERRSGSDGTAVERHGGLVRVRINGRFSPMGVTQMPSDGPPPFRRGGGGLTWRRSCYAQRLSLSGRTPSPLWWGSSLKRCTRRGTTRISRVRCGKAKRGCASRVPPLAWRNGAPHERGAGGESDPTLFAAGAPRGRAKVAAKVAALCPPCGEVALTTVIPLGRVKWRPEPGHSS